MSSSKPIPAGDERNSYTILADSQRRHALLILRESDSTMALADLATDIARQESENPDGDLDWERVKRIYTALYHNHIPRFDEAGMVAFNAARKTVTLADSTVTEKKQIGEG